MLANIGQCWPREIAQFQVRVTALQHMYILYKQRNNFKKFQFKYSVNGNACLIPIS